MWAFSIKEKCTSVLPLSLIYFAQGLIFEICSVCTICTVVLVQFALQCLHNLHCSVATICTGVFVQFALQGLHNLHSRVRRIYTEVFAKFALPCLHNAHPSEHLIGSEGGISLLQHTILIDEGLQIISWKNCIEIHLLMFLNWFLADKIQLFYYSTSVKLSWDHFNGFFDIWTGASAVGCVLAVALQAVNWPRNAKSITDITRASLAQKIAHKKHAIQPIFKFTNAQSVLIHSLKTITVVLILQAATNCAGSTSGVRAAHNN